MPFAIDSRARHVRTDRKHTAFALADDFKMLSLVQPTELSVGFPTVRLELSLARNHGARDGNQSAEVHRRGQRVKALGVDPGRRPSPSRPGTAKSLNVLLIPGSSRRRRPHSLRE